MGATWERQFEISTSQDHQAAGRARPAVAARPTGGHGRPERRASGGHGVRRLWRQRAATVGAVNCRWPDPVDGHRWLQPGSADVGHPAVKIVRMESVGPVSLSGPVAAIAHRATRCQTQVADHNPVLGPVPQRTPVGPAGLATASPRAVLIPHQHGQWRRRRRIGRTREARVECGQSDAGRTINADDAARHSASAGRHDGYQKCSTVGRTVGKVDESVESAGAISRPSESTSRLPRNLDRIIGRIIAARLNQAWRPRHAEASRFGCEAYHWDLSSGSEVSPSQLDTFIAGTQARVGRRHQEASGQTTRSRVFNHLRRRRRPEVVVTSLSRECACRALRTLLRSLVG
jgi:hypothetical protein